MIQEYMMLKGEEYEHEEHTYDIDHLLNTVNVTTKSNTPGLNPRSLRQSRI